MFLTSGINVILLTNNQTNGHENITSLGGGGIINLVSSLSLYVFIAKLRL